MVVAALLIAGIGFLLAGLLAIGFGIPVKEFSFGNTLILTGAVVACTGAMLLGLWVLVRELKSLALGSGVSLEPRLRNLLPSAASSAPPGLQAPEDGGFLFGGDQPAPDNTGQAARHRRRGKRRSPRGIACAPTRRNRPRLSLRSSRAEICCSPRHRGRNASAPRRERPIHPSMICLRLCP